MRLHLIAAMLTCMALHAPFAAAAPAGQPQAAARPVATVGYAAGPKLDDLHRMALDRALARLCEP